MNDIPEQHYLSRLASRRQALGLLAASAAGATLAGCTNTSDSGSSSNSAATGGSSSSAGGSASAGSSASSAATTKKGTFVIPDSGAKLPTGNVQLRWTDSGDAKAVFFKAFFPAYHKKHSNIKVDYNGTNWNQIQRTINLGLRNGSAPDVFQLPANLTIGEAVANGWVGVVEDIVPNWAQVRARYPEGSFANGVTDFNGKTYLIPFTSNARIGQLLLFNTDHTKKAGYDLTNKILSWDEYRAAAKAMTKQGNGKYYGVIFGISQSGGLSGPIGNLAEMAGVPNGVSNTAINWHTGDYNLTNPITIEAIELILSMKSDGSIFPGSASLDQPGARQRMQQGNAAMMLQGPWNITPWEKSGLPLGLNLPPQKDPKNIRPLTVGPGGANRMAYYSKSKMGPVIGDIYSYLSTLPAQIQWANLDGGGDPPIFPSAVTHASLDELNKKSLELGKDYTLIGPEPAVRNPDITKVYEAQKQVQPNFDDTLTGLFTGQITTSVAKAMKGVQDRLNKSLDDAIKLVNSRGGKVSRQDWVFADWDPSKPYTKLYKK